MRVPGIVAATMLISSLAVADEYEEGLLGPKLLAGVQQAKVSLEPAGPHAEITLVKGPDSKKLLEKL